ncbi:WD40 repeat-like protein [Auricularia subglabra TFB-10046 SS5]|nr:WD40 repeat-like protein [Auricularia subglabra TFB-10046 SS5]
MPATEHPPPPPAELFRTEADMAADEARRKKAEKLKDVGQPIRLPSKPIAMAVKGDFVWTAESSHVLRKTHLEASPTGATVQLYRGHEGPVSALAFAGNYVITGSWDKTIRVWDANSKALLSTTKAHRDFVKSLLVIPSLRLLASGSSDKSIRFWDMSDPNWFSSPLKTLGSISSHTRPVECLAADENSFSCIRLFSADSAGTIKVWRLDRQYGVSANCKAVLETELKGHRTGINEMWHGGGLLWTASTDYTVQLHAYPIPRRPLKHVPVLEHPVAVKCVLPLPATDLAESYVFTGAGDSIRAYDLSSVEEPELLSEIDAHANDVTSLAYWVRSVPGKRRPEVWIVSGSLDGTLRKWNLAELVSRKPQLKAQQRLPTPPPPAQPANSILTAEELADLEDLMDSEDSSSESSGGSPEPEALPSRQHSPPPASSNGASSNGSSAEALPAAIAT